MALNQGPNILFAVHSKRAMDGPVHVPQCCSDAFSMPATEESCPSAPSPASRAAVFMGKCGFEE